ncbi:MAG: hypothetical protein K0S77_2028, partial [Pseudomonas sp.]|nr:hypothetical protein [Pseudomonas sp.]
MRIRGQIGEWPVDLTIELDPAEWAQLERQLKTPVATPAAPTPQAAPRQDDGQWLEACDLLRQA